MENQQPEPIRKSKQLADCGLMAALTVILVLAAYYVPILGIVAMACMAVPTIILVMREPPAAAAGALLVAVACCILLGGLLVGISALILLLALGVVYGICFRRQLKPGRTLLFGTLAAVAALALSVAFLMLTGGLQFDLVLSGMRQGLEQAFAVYREAGVLDQVLPAGQTAEEYIEGTLALFQRLLPAIIAAGALLMSVGNYLVAALVLRRLQIHAPRPKPFAELHFSWLWLWGVIAALAAFLMGVYFDHPGYTDIAVNILCVYIPVCFISGLAVIVWLLKRRSPPRPLLVLLIVGCVLLARFTVPFFVILGVFDMAVDYRKLLRKRDELRKAPPRP